MTLLSNAKKRNSGATVSGYRVADPERYGVAEFDNTVKVLSIEERPIQPKSNFAVVGRHFYDNSVLDIARDLKPSARGEYEITDVNKEYLRQGLLNVGLMGRGFARLDTGTHDSLVDATNFVKAVEDCQGLNVACIEEIAYRKGFIDRSQFLKLAEVPKKSSYGDYLFKVAREGVSIE